MTPDPVTNPAAYILHRVAKCMFTTLDEVLDRGRVANTNMARQIAVVLITDILGYGPATIGRIMQRDHSTVLSNLSAGRHLIRAFGPLGKRVERLKASLEDELGRSPQQTCGLVATQHTEPLAKQQTEAQKEGAADALNADCPH